MAHPVSGTLLRMLVDLPPTRLGHGYPPGTLVISTGKALYHTEEAGRTIIWVRPDQPMIDYDAFPVYLDEVEVVHTTDEGEQATCQRK